MRRISKPLVAVLSGLALMVFMATPSSASTGTVNSGTLSVNLTPALNVNLAPGTGPCPGLPSALSLTATSSGGPGTYGVATTLTINDGAFTYGGVTYFLDNITASASNSTGLVDNAGADNVSTGNFTSSNGNIYPETSSGSCTPSTSPLCTAVRLSTTVPLSLSGTFPAGATGMTPNVVGTAVVSGSGGIQAAGCLAPFSALNGKTMTISNMDVTFV